MRGHLPIEHLKGFEEYCQKLGWKRVACKGEWEVLRMQHPEHETMTVHTRRITHGYYTTHGISEKLTEQFMEENDYFDPEYAAWVRREKELPWDEA